MGEEMKRMLSVDGEKKQIIGQAEILPMIVSRILWSGRMQGRDVIHYVDNDAARFSTIKGSSPSRESSWLIHGFWETEVQNQSHTWISRVPTCCNIGDGPSRDQWDELKKLYPEYVRVQWSARQESNLLSRWERVERPLFK